MEKDWKLFRKRVPEWRERFLERKNKELLALLTDPKSTPTEQFWNAEERTKELAKTLRKCFDGHSRSSMTTFLALMVAKEVINDDELNEFSDEVRKFSRPFRSWNFAGKADSR